MPDERTPPKSPRPPTLGDRNESRARVYTPPRGVTWPEFVDEEYTDRYAGEELRSMRERRPTPQRLARLEAK
ncbi:MAG TPA: hypothetical protein VNH40_00060, partial [Gaiellaceae bacterium]|nr:hypothetical protein [Gaiellaceae bacterium]